MDTAWYKKDFSDGKKFGAAAEMQGSCYDPSRTLMEVLLRQCGTLMLSKIETAIGTRNGGMEDVRLTMLCVNWCRWNHRCWALDCISRQGVN